MIFNRWSKKHKLSKWRIMNLVVKDTEFLDFGLLKSKLFKSRLHWHKKPRVFITFRFSLEVPRQLPLNTAKNPNRKTHLRSVVFWNCASFSLVFCQCKRLLPSHRYYLGFWSAESPATYCALLTVKGEKLRMRTTYQKPSMRFRFFCACAFLAKNRKVIGFSGSVNGYNKKLRFLGFWFLPM